MIEIRGVIPNLDTVFELFSCRLWASSRACPQMSWMLGYKLIAESLDKVFNVASSRKLVQQFLGYFKLDGLFGFRLGFEKLVTPD